MDIIKSKERIELDRNMKAQTNIVIGKITNGLWWITILFYIKLCILPWVLDLVDAIKHP